MYKNWWKQNSASNNLAEPSQTVFAESSEREYEHVAVVNTTSFKFLSGTIIWLDIISSLTTGRAPHLQSYHDTIISSSSQIQLDGVMGCKNFVMRQIGRIAAIHEQKLQAMQQDYFNCTELKQIVTEINQQIRCGLASSGLRAANNTDYHSTAIHEPVLEPPTLVSHIFACMASVYLHLVIEGFQRLEALNATVSEALRILQGQIPSHILSSLVAPLYVFGSVARKGDEQYFREIFSSPPLLNPSLKHREKILPILEGIWSKRHASTFFAWEDSLDIAHEILLI